MRQSRKKTKSKDGGRESCPSSNARPSWNVNVSAAASLPARLPAPSFAGAPYPACGKRSDVGTVASADVLRAARG